MSITVRLAAAATLCVSAATAEAATFGSIYAFGDSLTDCCFAGPFTNGPETWVPDFAAAIGADYPSPETPERNYAVGGAQSGAANVTQQNDVDYGRQTGLLSQIEQFEMAAPPVDADDLAIIWAGTNDISSASLLPATVVGLGLNLPLGSRPDVHALADFTVGNIAASAERLRDAGFGSLLLMTPYDVSQSGVTDFDPGTGPLQQQYSQAIRDRLVSLYTPGLDTWTLDMIALIEELQAGSPENGFEFISGFEACAPIGTPLEDCEARPQSEQDTYIFADWAHLTTATNAFVSERAAALVTQTAPIAPIPLPTPAVLLLAALGAFGAAGLRGRRWNSKPA